MHTYILTFVFRDGRSTEKTLTSTYTTEDLPDLITKAPYFTITEPNGDFEIIRMDNVLHISAKKVS